MNLLLPETKEIQSAFALYCRDGVEVELPGTTPGRLSEYRRLVFNIIEDNLESSFPIAHQYLDSEKWQSMLLEFFGNHKCKTYQVWQIAGEFYEYAINSNLAEKYQLPFLNDLLRFEWEEMIVYNMEDIPTVPFKQKGDFLNDLLVINPEHKILQLHYPVHIHNPLIASEKPGQYFVLVYREKESGDVQFMDISVWFALVIEQLSTGEIVLNDLINEAPKLFGNINQKELTQTTLSFLDDLKSKGFVFGYK